MDSSLAVKNTICWQWALRGLGHGFKTFVPDQFQSVERYKRHNIKAI